MKQSSKMGLQKIESSYRSIQSQKDDKKYGRLKILQSWRSAHLSGAAS